MSREGHKRFRTAKELAKLVGKPVIVTEFDSPLNGKKFINLEAGILKFKKSGKNENEGYYLNGTQISVRSIWRIYDWKIGLDKNYLTRNKIGAAA